MRRWLALQSMRRADLIVTPSDSMGTMVKTSCPQVSQRRFKTLYYGFTRASLHGRAESECAVLLRRPGLNVWLPGVVLGMYFLGIVHRLAYRY